MYSISTTWGVRLISLELCSVACWLQINDEWMDGWMDGWLVLSCLGQGGGGGGEKGKSRNSLQQKSVVDFFFSLGIPVIRERGGMGGLPCLILGSQRRGAGVFFMAGERFWQQELGGGGHFIYTIGMVGSSSAFYVVKLNRLLILVIITEFASRKTKNTRHTRNFFFCCVWIYTIMFVFVSEMFLGYESMSTTIVRYELGQP